MCNLRRHELLLHPLTLYFFGFLTLHVFWQHLVLQSWKLLASMQRLSNLHSSRTAAFPNPTLAFPCHPNSSAASHHAGTPRAREKAWESQGTRGTATVFAKTGHRYGGCNTLAWQVVEAAGLSVGCCVGILVPKFVPKGRIVAAALGSSYRPHRKVWKERTGYSSSKIPQISVSGQNFCKCFKNLALLNGCPLVWRNWRVMHTKQRVFKNWLVCLSIPCGISEYLLSFWY